MVNHESVRLCLEKIHCQWRLEIPFSLLGAGWNKNTVSLLFLLKKEHISDLWISKLKLVHSGPRTYTSAQLPLKILRPLPSILDYHGLP